MADAPDYPVDDVLAYGQANGYSPEDTATAVKQWREQALSYGQENSEAPDYFAGAQKVDALTQGALDSLRPHSNDPDDEEGNFSIPRQTNQVQPIMQGPHVLADYLPRVRDDGGLDLLMRAYDPDANNAPSYAHLKIPAVTDKDVTEARQQAAADAEKFSTQADDLQQQATDVLSSSDNEGTDLTGYGIKKDSSAARQKAADAASRATLLADPNRARAILTSERAAEALRKSPLADKVGRGGIGPVLQNFAASVDSSWMKTAALVDDTLGNKGLRDQDLEGAQIIQDEMGDSQGQFKGGVAAIPGETMATLGGFAPAIASGPAAPLVMAAQGAGDADARAIQQAKEMNAQAAELRAGGDHDKAAWLESQAADILSTRGLYAGGSASLMAAGGAVVPKLAAGASVAKAALRGGAEMTGIMTAQGQVLDPAFLGEHQRMSAGETLKQGALGAVLGAVHSGMEKAEGAPHPPPNLTQHLQGTDAAAQTASATVQQAGGDVLDQNVAGLHAISGAADAGPTDADQAAAALAARGGDDAAAGASAPPVSPGSASEAEAEDPATGAGPAARAEYGDGGASGTVNGIPPAEQGESMLAGLRTQEIPVASLKLSSDVPQFKEGADDKTGVVEPLSGKYERLGTAPILVWERSNGAREVISGRHRFDLARRTGEATIPAQVVREADGFTQQLAQTADAENNIRDGQGSVKDYANYFRHAGITAEEAEARGLRSRAKGRSGWNIGTQASPEVFDLHANDRLSDHAAEALAKAAPGNAGLQGVGLRSVLDGRPVDESVNMMRAVQAAAGGTPSESQIDLFGRDDSALRAMREQARRATQIQRGIREQISAASGAAKNPAAAAKLGVNVNDAAAVQAKLAALRSALERWEHWPLHDDLRAQVRGDKTPAATLLPEADTPFNLVSETSQDRAAREQREKEAADQKAEAEQAAIAAERDRNQSQLSFANDNSSKPAENSIIGVRPAAAADALEMLGQSDAGKALTRGAVVVRNPEELMQHPDFKDRKFSQADWDAIHGAEGFYDPVTKKAVVLTDQVGVSKGETPRSAVARVILHETVGHQGLEFMRRNSPTFKKAWDGIKSLIPAPEIAAIEARYPELSGDHDRLAEEWFAHQVQQLKPGELPKPGTLLAKMWQTIKDALHRVWFNSGFARSDGDGAAWNKTLDAKVRDLAGRIIEGNRHAMNRAASLDKAPDVVRLSYRNVSDSLMGFRREGPQKGFEESNYPHTQHVEVSFDGGKTWEWDAVKGMNQEHALERARRNWPGAEVKPIDKAPEGVRLSKVGDWAKGAKDEFDKLGKVPGFTDVKEAAQKWQGGMQRVVAKVHNIVEELKERVKDPLRREAITNYIEANGDAKELQKRAAASTGATEKFKRGYEAALTLTPEELRLANRVRDLFNSEGAHFQKQGILKGWLENYVNHVWKFEDSSGSRRTRIAQFTSDVSQRFAHAAQRKLGSFFEGEQKGLTPGTKDIADLLGSYMYEGHKALLGRQLGADLLKGEASDGSHEPLAYVGGNAKNIKVEDVNAEPGPILVDPNAKAKKLKIGKDEDGNVLTADGRKYQALPELSGLRRYKYVEKSGSHGQPVFSKGDLLLHPEAHKYLQPAFGRDSMMDFLRGESGNLALAAGKKLGLGVVEGQRIAKQFLFGWGGFHIVQEGTHAIGHLVNPFGKLEPFDPDSAEHTFMVNHGLMLGHDSISRKAWEEGLGAGGNVIEKIPGLGPVAKWLSDFTFGKFIPSLKIKTYRQALDRNMSRYAKELASGKVTRDDIGYLTGKEVNQAYGHLNKMDTGWGKSTQRIMSMGLLAPDFLEARARFALGAANDLFHGRLRSEQAMAMGVLAGVFYTAARALNTLYNDGDAKWDLKDAFTFVQGNRRWSMRSVPEDIMSLFSDPRKFIHGRVSPYGQTLQDLNTGKDYRGEPMGTARAFEETLLRHIPIAFRWAADYGAKKLTDAYPQTKGVPILHGLSQSGNRAPVDPWQQFLGSVGLHASRYSPITDAQRAATQWRETNDPTYKAEGSYPVSIYQKLRYALEDNNLEHALTEYKALLHPDQTQQLVGSLYDHTPGLSNAASKIDKGFHGSLFRPYTGSHSTDLQWAQSLTDDQKALKSLADERRQAVWQRFRQVAIQQPDAALSAAW